MAREDIDIWVRLRNARKAAAETRVVSGAVRGIGDEADRARRRSGVLSSALSTLGSNAGLAALGMGALAVKVGADSIGEWREAQKAAAQTEAVIRSTGGAAGVTATEIGALANRLSVIAGVDDEAIQGAENLLLTFTRVRDEAGKGNDVFAQATATIVDMSAALKQDLKSSTIQVGKALNDPVKGITALRRVGVSFTEQQQEQIRALVKSGDTLAAQKIILRELRREFAGSAKANADPLDRLTVSWKNLEETIGGFIGPKVAEAADWLATFIDQMQTGKGAGGEFVRQLRSFLGPLAQLVRTVAKFVGEHPALLKVLGVMVAIGAAVKAIRLVGTVTQMGRLIGLFGRLAGISGGAGEAAGASLAARLASRFRGAIGTRFPALRALMTRLFGSAGGDAGAAAAGSLASRFGGMIGGKLKTLASGAFAAAGTVLGGALAAAAFAKILDEIGNWTFHVVGGRDVPPEARSPNSPQPDDPTGVKGALRGIGVDENTPIIGDLLGHRTGARHLARPGRPAAAARRPALAGATRPIHLTVEQPIILDGREIARSTARHVAKAQAFA